MLRRYLLFLSESNLLRRFVTGWGPSRRMAERFVAGDELEQALSAASRLNQEGFTVTLDHLGENVETADQADRSSSDYLALLESLRSDGLRSGISIKLTQLGLMIDIEDCIERVLRICKRAQDLETFVRIDMEQSEVVDRTVQVLRAVASQGVENVGAVIQSYLYRTPEDTRRLLDDSIPIRLVKGAYDEPEEVAFPDKEAVDQAYDELTTMLLAHARNEGCPPGPYGGKFPPVPAIATHDQARIEFAMDEAERLEIPKEAIEFQFLYGIRSELQRAVLGQGYPVRVYIPYGTEWFPYFMRRLAERPANLWFFLSNLLRR